MTSYTTCCLRCTWSRDILQLIGLIKSAPSCWAVILYKLYIIMAVYARINFKDVKTKCKRWLKEMMNLFPKDTHPNALAASTFTSRRDITIISEAMAKRLFCGLLTRSAILLNT